MRKINIDQPVKRYVTASRQAETAAAPPSPGKIFLPNGTRQVSVNHWRPSFRCNGAMFERASNRALAAFVLRYVLPAACASHASGAVMATTERNAVRGRERGGRRRGRQGSRPPRRKLSLKLIIIAVGGLAVARRASAAARTISSSPARQGGGGRRCGRPEVKPVGLSRYAGRAGQSSSSGGGERTQYLKVKVVLEVPNEAMSAQIQPLMPRLMDAFQTYLRELRPTDLDGSAGLYRLKEELTRRVNAAIAPSRITAVLFKEIVVQ